MRCTQEYLWGLIYIFAPDTKNVPNLSIPEALNMAAVEIFLVPEHSPRYKLHAVHERTIRRAIQELRRDGKILFKESDEL